MRYVHGPFTGDDGEWTLRGFSQGYTRSERDKPRTLRKVLATDYMIHRTGQSNITARWAAMDAVLKLGNVDSGFILDGGGPSLLYLFNAGSLRGVQVVEPLSVEPSQALYATGLGGGFTVQADYPVIGADEILDYRESVLLQGNGGPSFTHWETDIARPEKTILTAYSICGAKQSGYAIGRTTWPSPNPPIWPAALINVAQAIGRDSPSYFDGEITEFRTTWDYIYESDTPLTGDPTVR